jgi:hypothetical protein
MLSFQLRRFSVALFWANLLLAILLVNVRDRTKTDWQGSVVVWQRLTFFFILNITNLFSRRVTMMRLPNRQEFSVYRAQGDAFRLLGASVSSH